MICLPGRAAAIQQLAAFIPAVPAYTRHRNFVSAGHLAVSRLSPAVRHRLLTEDEVADAVLKIYPLSRVEKFIQEIYWRRYWKAWLSLRPEVWTHYQKNLSELLGNDGRDLIAQAAAAALGNAVIDHFCRELVETGYLHNHARMWFAAWWIHEARLPWELGAEFFYRHLLDGDPASNTLSWRWVAGLHTPGKTYLARRSNLEKYLAPELAATLQNGLPAFQNPSPRIPDLASQPSPVTQHELERSTLHPTATTGLWIHEEDLSPETSPAATLELRAVIVAGHTDGWKDFAPSKRAWLQSALDDASQRASAHWQKPISHAAHGSLSEELISWARAHGIGQIATLRPEPGALADQVPQLQTRLGQAGIHLALLDRPRDLQFRPLAIGSFFKFWEIMQKRGLLPEAAPRQSLLDLAPRSALDP